MITGELFKVLYTELYSSVLLTYSCERVPHSVRMKVKPSVIVLKLIELIVVHQRSFSLHLKAVQVSRFPYNSPAGATLNAGPTLPHLEEFTVWSYASVVPAPLSLYDSSGLFELPKYSFGLVYPVRSKLSPLKMQSHYKTNYESKCWQLVTNKLLI